MWKLVIIDDEQQKTVVNLVRDEYTVGRAEGHAIRLTERNISRSHGKLVRTRNGFRYEDASSYNGVFVNGVRIVGRQELAHGDLVQIGDYRVHIVDEAIATQEQGYRPFDGTAISPASGRLPHRLVELIGPHQGSEYPLEGERFLIGRGTECEFTIDHGSVSRVHAEVRRIGEERFEIIDKGSANGLRINGRELNRALLDGRDVIEIGDVVLKYIPAGQVFRANADEGARIAALAGSAPPPAETTPHTGLAPSLIAAALGALIVGAIFLTVLDGSDKSNPALPKELSHVATLLDSGQLVEAGDQLHQLGGAERSLAAYSELERRWAEATLAQADALSEEEGRKLLDQVARTETLPADVREAAQKKLSAASAGAVDLTALDE